MGTEDARKLFMAGLPDSVTEEALRALFHETGANVTELTLPRDRTTGRPRGFAFVRLSSEDEAERARQDLDGRIVDGKMISVRPFHTDPPAGGTARGERSPRDSSLERRGGANVNAPDRTLYVGNLPYDATQEELDALLRHAGAEAPVKVYFPLDQDGRKRGFGFVTMSSAEAANAAVEALRGVDLRGRRLIVNIAHPKGERPTRENNTGSSERPARGFNTSENGSSSTTFSSHRSHRHGKDKDSGRRKKFFEEFEGGSRRKRFEREERWRDDDDDEDW